ncbi:tetratricopeptide repeat protein [Rhodopila sp.]|uniref:glycosyltransferase family 9 protein n=1 Tax=Rhodopila sp. TaxID=2480087 RepID=UPI003D11A961
MASPEQLEAVDRLLSSGAWHQAEVAAQAALADDPADPEALRLLGLAVAAMGENERAAPILNRAAAQAAQPDHPCADLAQLRPSLPRTLVARQFRACLLLAPDDDALRLGFASFLLDNGQPGEAERILQDGPNSAAGHHLRGLAQAELNQFVAAAESFRRAVTLNPDAAPSWSNLGMVLKIEGRFDEAIAAHDRAVVIGGGDPRHRVNRAVALLKAGRWTEAWTDYEARLDLTEVPLVEPGRLMPSLSPGDRLTGMTILAMHEDGFGDTLQFLRYLPLLAARGARVVAFVPRPLARLMAAVPGVASIVTDRRRLPAHDLVCPMFSLPRVFGTTVGSIPPVPEVAVDPDLVRHWAGRLPIGELRIGLVWAGQARPSLPGFGTLDRRRSAGLAAFQPVLDVPGVTFVSLQAGPAARQTRPPGAEIADPMPEVTDFADTAAIIAALDLVISVDTSVVHLAGLLGKPVFLLDRYDGCWRWLSGRRDSPWYPGLTIFRQDQPGDWSGAMARAAASLGAMAIFRGLGSPPGGMRECAFVAVNAK